MKNELKFNKIKHFLDKRGFEYEEMHEKKSNSYILYLSQYELCIIFLSRKDVSIIKKNQSPQCRSHTQREHAKRILCKGQGRSYKAHDRAAGRIHGAIGRALAELPYTSLTFNLFLVAKSLLKDIAQPIRHTFLYQQFRLGVRKLLNQLVVRDLLAQQH